MNEKIILSNYVCKDKIKAKIKELKKELTHYEPCSIVWYQLAAELDALEELLEEEV